MAANSLTSVRIECELTRERFDRLLVWLDSDRERAATKYEEIRVKLIKIFESRGWVNPEDLADETIDRVAKRIPEIADTYEGNPLLYFHGVARLVHLEYLRKQPRVPPPAHKDTCEETEQRHNCLEQCLERLTPANRELILLYYQEDKRTKVDSRKELARRLGITATALRIRAHRIRDFLSTCMVNCLGRKDL
jgi:RNA polymerase sigma factor (sigma-70 family)